MLQSCQRVPCPGSSGQRTAKPAAARCSPQGRMLIGVPVKPWTSRTPVRPSGPSPPGKWNGSAPGITSAAGVVGPDTGVLLGVRRRCRPVGQVLGQLIYGAADCPSAPGLPSLAVHEGGVLFYWFLKFVALGPALHVVVRPRAEGTEHVPATGGAILASNHLSAADWVFMPLSLKRRVTFLAKAEYFTGTGVKGFLRKAFFTGAGQVPDRPVQRVGRRGRHPDRAADPARGQAARHLPGGHPLARTAGSSAARSASPGWRWRPAPRSSRSP